MAQKTVLFFPLNSPGHINSSLGIADSLKCTYGYRTVFLLLGPMMGTSIKDHGHELIILDEKSPYKDYEIEENEDTSVPVDEAAKQSAGKNYKTFRGVFKWPQMIRRYGHVVKLEPLDAFIIMAGLMEQAMVSELVDNHDNYTKAIESIDPDLLIIDAYYVPPCVLKFKKPWVRLYSANPMILANSKLDNGVKPAPLTGTPLYNKEKREKMRKEAPEQWSAMIKGWANDCQRVADAMAHAGILLNEYLIKNGCSALPPGKQAHDSPHLNIYMYPKAIDYHQDDDLFEYPKLWLRCDSLIRQTALADSQESKELDEWKKKLAKARQGKQALVFFSLGSIASGDVKTMKRFVDYLSRDKKRLYVISKGGNGDQFQLCEDNMLGGNYIPQTFILQQADLAIIHGGNNSVTECMYYGKPMLVLPVFADQFDNAQRIEDLGLGRRLDVNTSTQDQLLQSVDEILADKKLSEKMHSIGQRMRLGDDLQKVTHLLAKLAVDGKLTSNDIAQFEQ